MLELTLKLADEERGLFLIALFEDLADADEHGPRYGSYDDGHHEREQQQQLLAQAHGASSSETPASCGAPPGPKRSSRTRPLTA